MGDFSVGDRVRLNRRARVRMQWARLLFGDGSQGGPRGGWSFRGNVREFRRCFGEVVEDVGAGFYGVRWQPSGLKYIYSAADLECPLPWERPKRV